MPPLQKKCLLAGRGSQADQLVADLVTPHASCSREHAGLAAHANGSLYVIDLKTAGGTFVNNVRIPAHKPTKIEAGDIVTFGKCPVQFKVLVPSSIVAAALAALPGVGVGVTPVPPPPPPPPPAVPAPAHKRPAPPTADDPQALPPPTKRRPNPAPPARPLSERMPGGGEQVSEGGAPSMTIDDTWDVRVDGRFVITMRMMISFHFISSHVMYRVVSYQPISRLHLYPSLNVQVLLSKYPAGACLAPSGEE